MKPHIVPVFKVLFTYNVIRDSYEKNLKNCQPARKTLLSQLHRNW